MNGLFKRIRSFFEDKKGPLEPTARLPQWRTPKVGHIRIHQEMDLADYSKPDAVPERVWRKGEWYAVSEGGGMVRLSQTQLNAEVCPKKRKKL